MSGTAEPFGEQPQCGECGAFEEWVDKYDEIKEIHDDAVERGVDPVEAGVPPGPWGYWRCPNGCGSKE